MSKVTKEAIDAKITDVSFIHLPGTTVTICSITLENGYSVRGESACVDPAGYVESVGRDLAYQNAFDKIWPLEGYLLAEKLHHKGRIDASWDKVRAAKEDILRLSHDMGFDEAIDEILANRGVNKVSRYAWKDTGEYIMFLSVDVNGPMHLYQATPSTVPIPWATTAEDREAKDWGVVVDCSRQALFAEHAELGKKLAAVGQELDSHVATPTSSFSARTLGLMRRQYNAMQEYQDALELRIKAL